MMNKKRLLLAALVITFSLTSCRNKENSESISKETTETSTPRNPSDTFFYNYLVSLAGAENSAADNLFKTIYDELNYPNSTSLANDKFLVLFVQGENKCAACYVLHEGIDYLLKNEQTLNHSNARFKLKTIFTDEELRGENTEDWKEESTVKDDDNAKTAFEAFLTRNVVYEYMSEIANSAANSSYYNSGKFDFQDDFLEFLTDPKKFKTPTLIQVDFTKEPSPSYNEITVYFNIENGSKENIASNIMDAWLYRNNFS